MDDIVEDLRATADDTDADMAASVALLLEKAADEIARLRLTDAEREAVECGISHILDAEYYGGQEPLAVATLRGLLERTK